MPMNLYLMSADLDDAPQEPLLANDVSEAADLYVQAVLRGQAGVDRRALAGSLCIWVSQFEPSEEGIGLMKDTMGTSVPMRSIPSWTAFLEKRQEGTPSP